MSTLTLSSKEAFERAWIAKFSSDADDTTSAPSLPSLSCWDSTGNLRSQEALRDELDNCQRRIADLRRNLRAEEFLEFYCRQELDRHRGSGSRAVAKRTASAPYRTSNTAASESPETSVQVEGLYSEPIDSRLLRPYSQGDRSPSPSDLYAVPVNAKCLERIPSVPEPLYAKPLNSKPLTPTKRVQPRVYEEINDVRAEKVDAGNNSSEDESVANLVAIRQSVSRLSQWCVDGEAARKKLALQAKRLSSRFSYAAPSLGSTSLNVTLDSVPESLFSPTTPSGMDFTIVCSLLLTTHYSCLYHVLSEILLYCSITCQDHNRLSQCPYTCMEMPHSSLFL